MIKSAEHFSFTVSNIEATLSFFCDLLGLAASSVMEVESPHVQQIVGMPGAVLRISIVQVPGGPVIELIQYVRPEGKRMYQDLSAKGVQFVNPPVWAPGNDGTGKWGVAYLKGPDDITIELVEKKI
jgi:catechol 2,3-dioxygenase-like lactoylglutathione lyase family enzyme